MFSSSSCLPLATRTHHNEHGVHSVIDVRGELVDALVDLRIERSLAPCREPTPSDLVHSLLGR